MTEFGWSVNPVLESASFKSCFAPFWLVPASATKSFFYRLALLHDRGLQAVGVRGARLILLGRTFIVLASPHGGICFRQLGFAVLADAKPGVSARPALLGVV